MIRPVDNRTRRSSFLRTVAQGTAGGICVLLVAFVYGSDDSLATSGWIANSLVIAGSIAAVAYLKFLMSPESRRESLLPFRWNEYRFWTSHIVRAARRKRS